MRRSHRIAPVALHEYLVNVRRPTFLLVTLGMPLLIAALGGISMAGATMATGLLDRAPTQRIGLCAPNGGLDVAAAAARSSDRLRLSPYPDEPVGLADVRAGRLDALFVFAPSYLRDGRVDIYQRSASVLNPSRQVPVRAVLTRALLGAEHAPPRLADRLLAPAGEDGPGVYTLDRRGRFVPNRPEQDAARVGLPYLFSVLFFVTVFAAAGYLLRGVADEKENRVIEVVLSSVTADDLLAGKLIGLAGVALTQVGVWFLMTGLPALLFLGRYIHVSASAAAGVAAFFALGFSFYASLLAGLGALGASNRESQQIGGLAAFGAVWPMMLMPAIIEYPNGLLARVLSYIPFTAPATMILRLTTAPVPAMELASAVLVLAFSVWLSLRLSARLFRFGLLIYGKRPTVREVVRYLRTA